ncbi:MAG: Diacylglycerol kinase [Candidatus Magasanikbacteria bacterium GW2011_GWA2_40_10]|uniref:Diacylglycerol kinase n=1 Tax=Candidatus Magasanikbacteria bacterium GW2011_GWA2_40_10 TaxID=1619037 RepID=A0A0G0Q3N4_9BACT|nr:MAG: Diacylglycerol kinase [Candidatus Magasanikbacteria bacterium GW2011_GWA2_40_10]
MSLRRLLKSFVDAIHGLRHVFKSEQNFRIQALIGLLVLLAAFYFPLRSWEVILLILLVLLVLLVEILNTVFEYFSDLLKPRLHHYVRVIKDVMAGAVLLTSLVALIVGTIIFYPYLENLIK